MTTQEVEYGMDECKSLNCEKCVDERRPAVRRRTSLWVGPDGAMILWCEIHDEQVVMVANDRLSEFFKSGAAAPCCHCQGGGAHNHKH